jgi:hypothetical protein
MKRIPSFGEATMHGEIDINMVKQQASVRTPVQATAAKQIKEENSYERKKFKR